MKTVSVSNIRLTKKKNQVCYRKYPKNPVFECRLNSDITQKLITDPGSIMKEKTKHRSFWLMLLRHSILSGGQFVFETFPPQDTNNQQKKLAARTLFQLDGDMLVNPQDTNNPQNKLAAVRTLFQLDGDMLLKIDENILARTDGIDIITAHLNWTNWCFEQLKGALSFTRILRCVQCVLCIIAVLLLLFGVFSIPGTLHLVEIVLMIGGFILVVFSPVIARKLISVCLKRMIKQSL